MVSALFFHDLVLFGLLWLCIMLHYTWPSDRPAGNRRTSKPAKPLRKRPGHPKPFPGLTRTPCCAACEQTAQEPAAPPPPALPPPITSDRGRPRQEDTSQQFCPDPDCTYRGRVGLGNISSNGHPNGGPWRQLYCSQCAGYFLETHGTPFYGKRVSADLLVWAVGALVEGLGIRAVARASRSMPTPCYGGWWRQQSISRPSRSIFCTTCGSPKCNSTSSMPCSMRSRMVRSARPR
jgi:hypothetical protein